ncbi:hypothetical protein HID58_072284 [Brassica napus]|uniref:Uncharacterized protein n=1 Tax=Brassica napus TaxID=3708 RepID=A0ABQ7Z402_BRANA|nr:hypothetical protein HID58_072284 [Brassica napus]
MKLCAAYQNYLQRKYLAWRSKLVMTVKRHQGLDFMICRVLFPDGKVQKMRERVEIDEENKSVFVFDGDVMPLYRNSMEKVTARWSCGYDIENNLFNT